MLTMANRKYLYVEERNYSRLFNRRLHRVHHYPPCPSTGGQSGRQSQRGNVKSANRAHSAVGGRNEVVLATPEF